MDVLTALTTLMSLTQTIGNLVGQAGQISTIVRQAQAEGRTALTATEWTTIQSADSASRQVLIDTIAKALAMVPTAAMPLAPAPVQAPAVG